MAKKFNLEWLKLLISDENGNPSTLRLCLLGWVTLMGIEYMNYVFTHGAQYATVYTPSIEQLSILGTFILGKVGQKGFERKPVAEK